MPGAHVELSPSSASRWMACPGSVSLLRTLPVIDSSSPYAEEGTVAHALAERAIRDHDGKVVFAYAADPAAQAYGPSMIDHVQQYVDEVMTLKRHPNCRYFAIENRLTLDALCPPAPMGGTADCLAVIGDRLHVVDLKYGRGVAVEVEHNPQLQYYALMGVLHAEAAGLRPWDVTLTVVQPRKDHPDGPVRRVDYTVDDLLAFGQALVDAAGLALSNDAPRAAGSWCKFCEAKPICPEQQATVRAMVAVDFDAVPASLPAPSAWSVEEIGQMLRRAEHLSDYIESCRKFLYQQVLAGASVSTHKLVRAQTRRKWRDDVDIDRAMAEIGLSEWDLYERKLITPAEAERRLKIMGFAVPEGLIVSPPGEIVLAPVTDRRPAVSVSAASDFSE